MFSSETSGERPALSGRFGNADESNLDTLAAFRAGHIERYRLVHNSFGNRRHDGIDVIEAMIQHLKLARDTGQVRPGVLLFWL
jgi:hypothetical protein